MRIMDAKTGNLKHAPPRPGILSLGRAFTCPCLVLSCVLAAGAAELPEECKPPASAAKAIHDDPSAKVWDATGAWFAAQGNLKCGVSAFEEAVRIEPGSAEAHYDLGVAHVRLNQFPAAAEQFRLALKNKPDMAVAHTSLGLVLEDLGKGSEAEAEFREALRLDPKSAAALHHLAQSLAAQRRFDSAIRYWNEALAIEPESPEILLSLGATTYQDAAVKEAEGVIGAKDAGTKEAIRTLQELIRQHPDMKAAHFTLGNIYANEARFREAADEYTEVNHLDPLDTVALMARVKALATVSAFEDALAPAQEYTRRKPADAEGRVLLGAVYKGLGEYEKAESELERAVAGNPNDFQAQYQLGFVLAKNQKPKLALTHVEKAVALKPSDSSAQFQLAAVLRTLGDSARANEIAGKFKASKSEEFKVNQLAAKGNEANELLQSNQPGRAVEVYRQMLELEPGNARTEYNLALALEAARDLKGAREALERAARLDPKFAAAPGELGRLDLAAGNMALAEKRLEAAVADDPQFAAALGNLGVIRSMKGDNRGAEMLLREAIEDDPNYVQGHLNLGLILAQQQKYGDAEGELDHALKLAPEDLPTLAAAGKVKVRLGKSGEGVALLRKVAALDARSAAAHLDLAIALADSYDLPGALSESGEAVRLAPDSASAHFNHGRVLFDLGRNAEAQSDFESACRLAPQMAEPHYYLAVIEKQAGHYHEAAVLLETVVRLQPRNVMAWYSLGQSREHESQTAAAIAAWRQAVAIDAEFSQALWSLARAIKASDPAEAARLMARYSNVQKKRRIVDQAGTLGNDALAASAAHEWPEAVRQLKQAIEICGDCVMRADLHKNLGLIDCQMGDIDNGEKELRYAQASKPSDPDIARALSLVALARAQRAGSQAEKAH